MAYDELLRPSVVQPASGDIVSPPGFSADSVKSKTAQPTKKPTQAELDKLKIKKAWEVATGPAKSIPMNLIMSYMTGNSLQMIPIMMTLMLFWNPLKAIFSETGPAFRDLANERNSTEIILPKIVFVLCQLANMAVGVWKLYKMGLVPNGEADWLAWKVPTAVIERLAFTL